MSELQIYNALERMVKAAENNDRGEVIKINNEFSRLLYSRYGHLKDWTILQEVLLYDAVRNRACDSVTNYIQREDILKEMKERFSKIPKP